jgi:uncharacterized membrane protein
MGTAAGFAAGLVVVALLCFAMSLAVSTGSLTPGGVLGIRTRATRASAEAWYVGHRAAQPVLRLSGLICLVAMAALLVVGAAVGSHPDGATVVTLTGLACYLVVVLLLAGAAVVADRAARATQDTGRGSQDPGRGTRDPGPSPR